MRQVFPRYKPDGAARSNEPWTYMDPEPELVGQLRHENTTLRETAQWLRRENDRLYAALRVLLEDRGLR